MQVVFLLISSLYIRKDLNGKELGTRIMQRKDGRFVGRFVNRFGKREEVKSRDIK